MAEPSTVKLPELPTPHRFWPYAPVDGEVFHREQMEAYATSAVLEAIKRCATISDEWSKPDVLRLAAGEMTTQEMRSAQAVARGIAAAIRERKDASGCGCAACLDLHPPVRAAALEEAAKVAEQQTHKARQAKAWANTQPIKPCDIAAAIRALGERKGTPHHD